MVASEAEGRAEALRRMAACRAAQSEELDLGGLQLTVLNGEPLTTLCQLSWLRRLFLGPSAEARGKPQLAFTTTKEKNALGALPGDLFEALTRLERLDLALNRLRRLPSSIANRTTLTGLNLAGNRIEAAGARALKKLVNLTTLDLSYNRIGAEGANALKGLVNLTSLNLDSNDIGPAGRRLSRASSTSPAST
jgi:Leucine-rich repeat (LRR) protein